jgi:ribosome-interacting GTPase 1
METRSSSLELLAEKALERITVLEVNLAVVKSNYATKEDIARLKEDIAKLEATLLKWFVEAAVTIASLSFAAARFIS